MCVYRHTRVTACNFQNPYTCFEIKMAKEEAAKEELVPLLPSLEISTLISYLIDTLMFNLDLILSLHHLRFRRINHRLSSSF